MMEHQLIAAAMITAGLILMIMTMRMIRKNEGAYRKRNRTEMEND